MLAGPTEALIVSDRGNPAFTAADLLAQAEHDPETLALFITTSASSAARCNGDGGWQVWAPRTAVLIASRGSKHLGESHRTRAHNC